MRYFLLFVVVIFIGCSSQQSSKVDEKKDSTDLVELQIRGYFLYTSDIEIYAEVINNSMDTIVILRGFPLKDRENAPSKAIVPYFFSAEFNGDRAACLTVEPLEQGAFLQETRFFTTLLPGGRTDVKLKINDYEQFYCGDLNFEVKVTYEFDERLMNKVAYDQEIASKTKQPKGVTDHFYEKMMTSFRGKLEASIRQEVTESEVYIDVRSVETINGSDFIEIEVNNKSDSAMQLLQPRPVENGRELTRKMVIPEFFNVQCTETSICDTVAYELLDEIKFKTTFDFIEIAPGHSEVFTLIGSQYFAKNCSKENTIEITYQYEKRFDDIEYFNSELRSMSQFGDAFYQRVHNALVSSYKKPMKTTIYLK